MEIKFLYTELVFRKTKLKQVKIALKEKFLGLDEIIDEVISLMVPWFLFPQAQSRPTIVNLWGLTGSGKTALVQAIVELLEYKKLYSHIDMGEFESDSASWMKAILTEDLAFFHEKSPVICLDEFQLARTLDKNEDEMGKDKLRVVWDLLDSGKIEYIPGSGTFYLFRADNCLKRLEKLIKKDVVIKDGIVIHGVEHFVRLFEGFYFDYNDRSDAVISSSYFLSEDFINGIFFLFEDDDFSREQLRARIRTSTLEELTLLLKQGMHTRPATKTLDLSQSLIFVLGNLDEAYSMSHSMNPDISADEFHDVTARITISDIKRALQKRFRPEQIARLGNNHIIYRSFNSKQFRALIRQELDKVAHFVARQFGCTIHFEESVVDIVYSEGVFPAQGTRPVFTTIKNLIESKVGSLIVSILENQLTPSQITWSYGNGKFVYDMRNTNGDSTLLLEDHARLKLDNLRRSIEPQIQAHTAVHEAGHAVLAALTLRIIPSVVVSRTASDMEGFCLVNFPKGPMTRETLKKDIIISLGGYVAEKLIFGEEMTSSGVYSDIKEASALANRAVREFAMGCDPIHLAVGTQDQEAFIVNQQYNTEAIAIIKDCEAEALELLTRNKLLLLKIAEHLTSNSRMEAATIATFVRQYGAENWIRKEGFIAKEEYYRFNDVLCSELAALEKKGLESVEGRSKVRQEVV